jgi:hypothetical protein
MEKFEYDGATTRILVPSKDECQQIVADVAGILVNFTDCRQPSDRAYIIDQIARAVFRGHYEAFVLYAEQIDQLPWDLGILPQWEGRRDEYGDPIVDNEGER